LVALVITLALIVALLAVLVAGLLRSHADILKALHDLGAGVGDPTLDGKSPEPATSGPLAIGPPLPRERDATSAPDVAGVTPEGDARSVAVGTAGGYTLLSFLSSGCSTCANFWTAFRDPATLGLPDGVRLVVVTKGPDLEIAGELRGRTRLPVVMSTEAWREYEVPGSPFFVLVDGSTGRRIGEGVANHLPQVMDLVRRARVDAGHGPGPAGSSGTADLRATGLDGPARERANDAALRSAGILPGDPSLYPGSLDEVFPAGPGRA
jgi:hypothetical protein